MNTRIVSSETLPPAGWKKSELLRWMRRSPGQAALSLALLAGLIYLFLPAYEWLIRDASLRGSDKSACTGEGACWVFIKMRFLQFMFGFYPQAELWRPLLTLALWIVTGLGFFRLRRGKILFAAASLIAVPLVSWGLLEGPWFGLVRVDSSQWGGLFLTLLIAVTGITLSLPLGILLALGRRSELPIIRWLSLSFIELWRGVPLIAVLFMASVMLPLFLPPGVEFDKLLRCLIGVTLFAAAYMAEVVRGGLQAVPRGQYEAALALNLSYAQTMGLVILPQALRKVIPGIVNTFIGLFKDSSLVLIIGMFDLLGMVQAASTDPQWLGMAMEGYLFAGFVFWLFSFAMSRYSMRLERRLGTPT